MGTDGDDLAELPTEIDVAKFVSYRVKEIELLEKDTFLAKEDRHKSLFQLLPRHMRRRTMGYIRKRLPRKIRTQSIIKLPSKKNKRPSRKYRRRPGNLLSEYERRKRQDQMWLETHIWHAKRFHMIKLFNYKLPLHDNCKNLRPMYRSLSKNCVIHDESYHTCWQLEGTQEYLITCLSKLCSTDAGLTFAAKMNLDGRFEGKTVIYEADKYPYNCLGPVRYLWKPLDETSEKRVLWLWTHPAIFDQMKSQFVQIFDIGDEQPENKKAKMSEDVHITKNLLCKTERVSIVCLKDKLVRFKLLGPMSTTILAFALQAVDLSKIDNEWSSNEGLTEFYLKSQSNLDSARAQQALWGDLKNVSHPGDVTPSTVIGLLVRDPRIVLPKRKLFNTVKEQNKKNACFKLDENRSSALRKSCFAYSAIWSESVVKRLNEKKMSTHEINKLRAKYLIPGTEMNLGANESKIPILLVQTTSETNFKHVKNGTLLSGWDVIVPNSWAVSFWQLFVHLGAKAAGQKEMQYLHFESANLFFPNEYYDCEAGLQENNRMKEDLLKKYKAKPASKRVNYLNNGFLNPFHCPLQPLIETSDKKFFILRNKKLLTTLRNHFFGNKLKINAEKLTRELKESVKDFDEVIEHSFVNVRLSGYEKGTLAKNSQIYALNKADLNTSEINLNEQVDFKKVKQALNTVIKNENLDALVNDDVFAGFQKEIRNSRKLIGFVINSKFSLVNGQCSANATIKTKSIIEMILTNQQNTVVYKTPSCLEYKFAKINYFYI